MLRSVCECYIAKSDFPRFPDDMTRKFTSARQYCMHIYVHVPLHAPARTCHAKKPVPVCKVWTQIYSELTFTCRFFNLLLACYWQSKTTMRCRRTRKKVNLYPVDQIFARAHSDVRTAIPQDNRGSASQRFS